MNNFEPRPCRHCGGFCGDSGPTCDERYDAAWSGEKTVQTNQAAQTMPELAADDPIIQMRMVVKTARANDALISRAWVSGWADQWEAERAAAILAVAPAASGIHPDALPDGTLSKSTAKRLAAASVSERARAILKSEMGGFGTDTQGRIPLEYALRAIEQALTQQRGGPSVRIEDLGQNAPLWHEERGDAEQAYTLTAFDYESAQIGSRDWELYWRGWWHRSQLYTTPQPSADAVRELQSACEPFIRHNSSEQFIDLRVPTSAITKLRSLLDGKGVGGG